MGKTFRNTYKYKIYCGLNKQLFIWIIPSCWSHYDDKVAALAPDITSTFKAGREKDTNHQLYFFIYQEKQDFPETPTHSSYYLIGHN